MSHCYVDLPERSQSKCIYPETNIMHRKIDGWKMSFLLGRPIFSGYVSFRECTYNPITGHRIYLAPKGKEFSNRHFSGGALLNLRREYIYIYTYT